MLFAFVTMRSEEGTEWRRVSRKAKTRDSWLRLSGSPEWRHPVLTSPKLVKIHKSLARPSRGRFPAGRRGAR